MHLAELKTGEKAAVIGVAQGEAFCQLCALGLTAGAEVEIVRFLSRRSLLVVRVDGADIALRRETAQTVKIAHAVAPVPATRIAPAPQPDVAHPALAR